MTKRVTESEKLVEEYLRTCMKEIGGKAYKWESPGNMGVPDRLCIFPDGRMVCVELKGTGGRLTPSQKHQFQRLHQLRAEIYILWSRAEVDRFIEAMGGDCGEVCAASISSLLYSPAAG